MAVDTRLAKTAGGHVATVSIAMLAGIGAKAHAVLRSLQTARMASTLSNMSDGQLAQIGISRSDILKYAETLMADN